MNQAEESLKLFKTIFDQTPVSTQIFTPDGQTLMVNKAWEKLWNVKAKMATFYNILQDQQLVETGTMPYIKRGFRGETVMLPVIKYEAQKTVKIKDASTRWLSAKMYPIKNRNGKITHIVLQHEDITDRNKADEALKISEERFRTLTSHAPVGIFLTDKEGNCLFVNERWCKFAGISNAEAMGNGWTKAIHPDDKEAVFEAWYSFAKTGKEFNMEYRFLTPQGKVTWLSGTAIAIRNQEKNIAGYMGTVADITDRKLALESLERSEERLRLALNAGKIGVWDWDIASNSLTWTDNVYAIHGVSRKHFEVTFDSFQGLIHSEDRNRIQKLIKESLEQTAEFDTELRIITPKGEVRWLATRAAISHDKKGKPIRMIGATIDITHQKQIEQEKSDFISMASHELKTPITSMKMFSELLNRELAKGTHVKPKHLAERIQEQTNRLIELTNDLLDVSRIETGKLKLKKETFDVLGLVKEAVQSLQPSIKTHKLRVRSRKGAIVLADRYRIYQVLVNLITNAVKYSPNGKEVSIGILTSKNAVTVSVKDQGIGIAKEKQEKIFDRLYQVSDSKLKSFPGLGLGLYISKEIIERHKGKLWLKSTKGKGSTFYFSLALQHDKKEL